MNKFFITSMVAFGLLVQTPTYAQETTATVEVKTVPEKTGFRAKLDAQQVEIKARKEAVETKRKETHEEVRGLKADLKTSHEELKNVATSTRKEMKADFRAEVKDTHEQIQGLRQDRKDFATGTRTEIKTIKAKRAETKMEIKAQLKITTDKKTRILNEQLEKLIVKKGIITGKLETIKGKGVDTTAIESKLVEVDLKIASAKGAIEAIRTFVPDMKKETIENTEALRTETKAKAEELRNILKKAQDEVQSVHKALSDIIPLVRGLGVQVNASSTVSTTN